MTSQTLTVLFADLSGSTQLYQMQGDVEAHQRVSQSLSCMRSAIERHGGALLRTVGDAALASFADTDAACEAAIEIQRQHSDLKMPVRVGFHFGEVILDAGDLYGHCVNLTARVAQFAEANEICTTEESVARLALRHRNNAHFLDNVEFKGVSAALSIYRIHWRTDTAETAIVASFPAEKCSADQRAPALLINGLPVNIDNNKPTLTLGRALDSDIVVKSESASRNHASIEWVRGRYVLTDTSTNGTYLLKGGATPDFIRRESLSLDQFGVIGLGFDPLHEPTHAIKYQVIVAES